MKKLILSLALVLASVATFAQHSVAFADAHWGFEAGEASRPNYTTNTAFAIPTSWVVGTATATSYRPYIYPNGNQGDKADQGHTGRYCLYMNQPNSASRLPVFAMLPTVSDKQMNTLSLEFWARTFNSQLDVNTSNTVYGDWKFGYISSLADTVKANFTQNVHYLKTVELTANWTKYTLDLKDFPAGAYPVIYIDAMGDHNVRYAYIDDVAYVIGSSVTPGPGPEPEPTTYTVTYNLTGCVGGLNEAEEENPVSFEEGAEELDLYFALGTNRTWDNVQISIMMGETEIPDGLVDYSADPSYMAEVGEDNQLNIYISGIAAELDNDIVVTITAPEAFDYPTEFTPATFEDITVGSNGVFYDPAIQAGNNAWLNGSFKFYTYYSAPSYYSDIVVSSNVDPSVVGDYYNPASYLYAPSQTPDGSNFAVWNQNFYGVKNVYLGEACTLTGMYVNNTSSVLNYLTSTYTTFHADGFFMLTVTGYNNGVQTGTINHYLVDWRDVQNKKTQTNWEWLDLSSLGNIDELNFNVYSDDMGQWGLNTPAYFCFDNLGGEAPSPTTGCKNITDATKTEKVLMNGQVLIIRNDRLYNTAGQLVR